MNPAAHSVLALLQPLKPHHSFGKPSENHWKILQQQTPRTNPPLLSSALDEHTKMSLQLVSQEAAAAAPTCAVRHEAVRKRLVAQEFS